MRTNRTLGACVVTAGLALALYPLGVGGSQAHAQESAAHEAGNEMTAEVGNAKASPAVSSAATTPEEKTMGEEPVAQHDVSAASTQSTNSDASDTASTASPDGQRKDAGPELGADTTGADTTGIVAAGEGATPGLSVEGHVQNVGWQKGTKDSNNHVVVGTTGRSLRVEALRLSVTGDGVSSEGSIMGKAHVQDVGWVDWTAGDKTIGTTGRSRRVESVRLKLSDKLAASYDLWYRVHVQNKGWMGWASNGQLSGTAGLGLRMEAVELALLPKGSSAPGATDHAFEDRGLAVNAHVENVGWQGALGGYNVVAGTYGRSLRMEALSIEQPASDVSGDISYEAHVQNEGWQSVRRNGAVAGSTGRGQRIEAIKVFLSGDLEATFDVWYRLHVQDGGWMAWASNGQKAGTEGLSMRVEAIQIALLPKGSTPSSDGQSISVPFVQTENVSYHQTKDGSAVKAFEATVAGDVDGSISYSAHVSNVGWTHSVANGAQAGDVRAYVEGFSVSVGGEAGKLFNVWYRGYVRGKGWMGWTSNGRQAGSVGCGLPLEDMQIMLLPKSMPAPGSTVRPLYTRPSVNIVQMIYPQLSHGSKPASCQRYIVMHDTEGISIPENAVYGWVASGTYKAAHFVIGLDGKIIQCVPLDHIAHHAGWGGPGFNARFGVGDESRDDRRGTTGNRNSDSYGMNSYSIGIELIHVSASHAAYPEAQLNALDGLIAHIDSYYGFESQIIQHKDWRPGNSDCSDEFQPILANLQRTRNHSGI